MLRPSGVSSASEASWAASASARSETPAAGRKAAAWRLPRVMVPVLSSRRTSTSPAASTARPEVAITLCSISRLMPATPIAESRPPMVVGIRQTRSAASTVMASRRRRGRSAPRPSARRAAGWRRPSGRRSVSAASRIDRAISLGVLPRRAPSTILIIRSMKGFAGVGGDLDEQPVREHPGAAGDRGEVAARLADHRRGLAGDRAFVDRGHAFDHLAVGRDQLAGLDEAPRRRAAAARPAPWSSAAPWRGAASRRAWRSTA